MFGSQSSGQARPDSDVDLGVLYGRRRPLAATLTLEQQVEEIIGRHVDVVDLAHASAFLALDVVRGERVFCRDCTETDRFELYVLWRAGRERGDIEDLVSAVTGWLAANPDRVSEQE